METRSVTKRFRTDVGTAYITITKEPGKPRVFIVIGKPGSALRAIAGSLESLINRLLDCGKGPEEILQDLRGFKTTGSGNGISSLPEAVAMAMEELRNAE